MVALEERLAALRPYLYKEHCVLEGGCSSSSHGIREGGRMEWGSPGLVEPRSWGFCGGFLPMRVGYPCPV